jgi:hypothetical protein
MACFDVEDACLANEVLGVVGEEVALSRHHSRGDCAFVAADDRVDPERQSVAGLIDSGVKALAPGRVARRGRRWIGPNVEPTAPTPAKNASRAKSYPPGSAARVGGAPQSLLLD